MSETSEQHAICTRTTHVWSDTNDRRNRFVYCTRCGDVAPPPPAEEEARSYHGPSEFRLERSRQEVITTIDELRARRLADSVGRLRLFEENANVHRENRRLYQRCAALREDNQAIRASHILPGWFCPACAVFNGETKSVLSTCRCCGWKRPEDLSAAVGVTTVTNEALAFKILEAKEKHYAALVKAANDLVDKESEGSEGSTSFLHALSRALCDLKDPTTEGDASDDPAPDAAPKGPTYHHDECRNASCEGCL